MISMANLEGKVKDADAALDVAEGDLARVEKLAADAHAATVQAEEAYDADATDKNGECVLSARKVEELAGVRVSRARGRVEEARAHLSAAQTALGAELARVEEERRKAALESAARRASAATFRAEAAEDIARFVELEKERRAIAARLEARVEAAQEAAREARELGAELAPLADRIGEALLLHRLMAELPAGEASRERWTEAGVLLYPLFSAWRAKAANRSSVSFNRAPLDHCHALAAAFPEVYRNRQVPSGASKMAMRQVARFEAGEAIEAIFEPSPSGGPEHDGAPAARTTITPGAEAPSP